MGEISEIGTVRWRYSLGVNTQLLATLRERFYRIASLSGEASLCDQ